MTASLIYSSPSGVEIQKSLFSFGDSDYKAFHAKLIPTVPDRKIIGVRTPALRKYAKKLFASADISDFLEMLPHRFYEEDNLHAFMLEQIKDYSVVIRLIDRFLPYIDNWATCDMMSPSCFAQNTDKLYKDAFRWIDTGQTYAVRFGVCMLMKHYLDVNFDVAYLEKVADIKSEEYYVKMAVAWYFATALTKRYDEALTYIEKHRLDAWTHNKAIQKACESYQVPKAHKEYLKTLKIK